jgi:hypothetical protein
MLIETQHVTPGNLPDLLATVQGCWKSSSLLWLQTNDFPVLTGVVVSQWSDEAEEAVLRLCREGSFSELLVRIEKPGQRWTRRRGGYTIPVRVARGLVDELEQEGMLTLLLEPASPYSDLYSLTSVCDLVTGKVDVEVVGPGFDASDILRSDTTPHERLEASLGPNGELRPRRSHLVEPQAYRTSVQRRLTKVGARLRNPSFPEDVLQAASGSVSEQLAQDATHYLKKTGQTLLLDHLEQYEPIPSPLLEAFLRQFSRLVLGAIESHMPWQALSVAGSFFEQGRLVIWDFFVPANLNTSVLTSLSATHF